MVSRSRTPGRWYAVLELVIGLWSLILVRPDMPDDLAYRLARALHRGEAALAARLPQGRYTTAANTAREVPPERLHPGAARYYKEAGVLE